MSENSTTDNDVSTAGDGGEGDSGNAGENAQVLDHEDGQDGQGDDGVGSGGEPADDDGGNVGGEENTPDYGSIELPEGMARDERFETFLADAGEHNLTPEAAQHFLNMHAEAMEQATSENEAAWQAEVEGWKSAVKSDKELGGNNLPTTESNVARAMEKFGSPELKEFLNSTQVGDHPEMVRTFAKIGQVLAEDQPLTGGARGVDPFAAMYPNSVSKG